MNADFPHQVEAVGARALALLVDPFVQVAFVGSLFWWPYLLIALGVALAFYWVQQGGGGLATLAAFGRRFFSRRIWAHPSAQADYAYYLVNSVLYPVIVAPLIVSGAAVGGGVDAALARLFGPMGAPLLGPGPARAVYTLLFFLVYDGARYLGHSLLHDVPILWHFHKLHHSAEVLTPFTNFRAHPVELFVMGAVPNLATGLLSGVVWYLAADTIGFYTFLGLHVFLLLFNTIANLRHFEVWISFGPVLNRWLISPAHHRIHHSCEPRHFGRNRGFELAVWDRLFGTLYVPGAEEEFRLGLGDGTERAWHSVGRMYGWPCRYALAHLGLGRAPAPRPREVDAAARDLLGRFWRDRSGNYSMMVVLLLPVLTGFVGVGTEAGLWLYDQQTQQAATDAAAFSAATYYATQEPSPAAAMLTNAETQAFAIAANYGFTSAGCQSGSTSCSATCSGSGTSSSCSFPANCSPGTPGTGSFCVQVNFWPKTGPYAPGNNTGSLDAFEVKIAQSPQQLFSKVLLGNNPVTIQARSVGLVNTNAGSGTSTSTTTTTTSPCNSASCVCIKVSSVSNAADSTAFSGSSTINLNGCSLEVDDPNSSALALSGSTVVSAGDVFLANAGEAFSKSGSASLSGTLVGLPATTGNITSTAGSCNTITSVVSTTNISVGMTVTDTSGGIPSGTTVTAINGTTLTLSACATKTVSADALTFTFTDPYAAQEAGNLYTGGPVTIPTITSSSLGGCATATSGSGNLTTNITGSASASYPTNSRYFTSVLLSGSGAFTIAPGVYYICPGGSFAISSSASLSAAPFAAGGSLTEGGTACTSPYLACKGVVPYQNGDGVTFVLLGLTNTTTGAVTNCASFAASGSAALNLVPPNSGPFSGILITSSPNCTAPAFGTSSGAESLSISGSATQNLFGAINLPQYAVNYSGSSAAASGGCLNLIANSLRISGSAGFGNNCTGVGTTGVGPATTTTTTTTTTTSGASTYSASLGN